MTTISVVVPVYYNAESLPLLFAELKKVESHLGERDCALELIFVDDGSGDESMMELLKIKKQRPNTRVVKLTRNFGEVHACKAGLKYATGDCVMWLAADLQDPPELIVDMTDKWLAGSKFVIALRTRRRDPPLTLLFAGIYHWLIKMFISKDYPAGGFDRFLLDATLIHHIRDSSKNINTSLLAYWLGYEPAVVFYDRAKREHGRSRWTLTKKLNFFIDSVLGFSVLPIRMISAMGLLVSLLSFGYGLYIVINTIFGDRDVPAIATLAAMISFLLGMVMVMLGIIGEYVWRIFDEVIERPEFVVDEVY
ncbi:glycosyltransferase family 2 protein [Mycolicibacterium sp.]|uniref:glycosyltransferase family 2 protein n=1 Tax=Mycolicibacterium sp. TaxID=2320850 RepID=UPI0025D0A914|nr:glycosyltransferase family 2 protein [Mycolicibacterium sp.]